MAFIDGTVVNVALPALQENLKATVLDVQWVVESYALVLAALLLVGGSMGDRFGRRRVFCWGISLFALASIACGMSQSVEQLIIARAVQGGGGALLVPGSLAIISAAFHEDRRDHRNMVGFHRDYHRRWSGHRRLADRARPPGGTVFINVPLALVVLLLSFIHVPESRDSAGEKRLDWRGAVLATVGLGTLVYGLIESSRLGFAMTGTRHACRCVLTGGFPCGRSAFPEFNVTTRSVSLAQF